MEEALEDLVKEGILRAEPYVKLAVCGRCGSHKLIVRSVCPYCGSVKFERTSVIKHSLCGYSGLERDFLTPSGDLVCPKCGKRLKAIGVDYLRTSGLYHCKDCGREFSIPEMRYVCVDCGYENSSRDLKFIDVFRYSVVSEKIQELKESSRLIGVLNRVNEEISELEDLVLEGPEAVVKGVSGMDQRFTFVLRRKGAQTPLAVIDVVPPGREVKKEDLIRFFAKAFDANPKMWILVVPRGLDDEFKEVVERHYRIRVIEIGDLGELPEKILEIIREILRKEDSAGGEVIFQDSEIGVP